MIRSERRTTHTTRSRNKKTIQSRQGDKNMNILDILLTILYILVLLCVTVFPALILLCTLIFLLQLIGISGFILYSTAVILTIILTTTIILKNRNGETIT